MSPQESKFLADFFLSVIEDEVMKNVKIFKAIPEARCDYRPHPRSRNALEIARHMAVSDLWFLDAVIYGQFPEMEKNMESGVTSVAKVIDLYEEKLPAAMEKLKSLSGEQLTKELSLAGIYTYPAVGFLSFMIRHTVHHRGQLSAYLRSMGSRVPRIYGPSADEPIEMSGPSH